MPIDSSIPLQGVNNPPDFQQMMTGAQNFRAANTQNQLQQQQLANSQQDNQIKKLQTTNAQMDMLSTYLNSTDESNYEQRLKNAQTLGIPGVENAPKTYSEGGAEWLKGAQDKNKAAMMQLDMQTKQADIAMKEAHANYFNQGGATGGGGSTGALMKQLMAADPTLTPDDALARIKGGANQGIKYNQGVATPMQGYAGAKEANAYGAETGKQQAQIETAEPKALNTARGKTQAGYEEQALGMKDMVDLYGKIKEDAKTTPSGFLSSSTSRLANAANVTTEDTLAQARLDADLNNLYLGTIRSMKGTGRIMEAELKKIEEASPKPTDSNSTKIEKAKTHMEFYKKRMQEIGFDPETGKRLGAVSPDKIEASSESAVPDTANADIIQQGTGKPVAGTKIIKFDDWGKK